MALAANEQATSSERTFLSVQSGQGKTFVILLLANYYASKGKSVCILTLNLLLLM
jgi:Mrp family chromosome partitioning ATPase